MYILFNVLNFSLILFTNLLFYQEERFHDLTNMSEELVRENYHSHERVKKRETEVLSKWRELLLLLDKHRANLNTMCTLMSMLREIDTIMSTIKDLEVILYKLFNQFVWA